MTAHPSPQIRKEYLIRLQAPPSGFAEQHQRTFPLPTRGY